MCNCQLCWQWWAQVESNHRPHAYQACALTFWAMSPCYLHNHRYRLIRRSVSLNLYGFGFATDGGDEGIRTLDPLLAGQVLSQLSYTPIFEVRSKSEEWKGRSKLPYILHSAFSQPHSARNVQRQSLLWQWVPENRTTTISPNFVLRRLFCFFVSYEKSYSNSSCSP